MIVRALDNLGDWQFGQGLNNYLKGQAAIGQSIQTRISMWANDCFFSQNGWIDWLNLLGSKNTLGLDLAIKTIILNSYGVLSLTELTSILDPTLRSYTVQYSVTTIFSIQTLTSTATISQGGA
jgi:hypothetical protein